MSRGHGSLTEDDLINASMEAERAAAANTALLRARVAQHNAATALMTMHPGEWHARARQQVELQQRVARAVQQQAAMGPAPATTAPKAAQQHAVQHAAAAAVAAQQQAAVATATAAAVAQQQAAQQQAVAAAARVARATGVEQAAAAAGGGGGGDLTNRTIGPTDQGVIPIGFFRDPRGNAWAASLQPKAREQPRARRRPTADEIIEIISDDDEDEEEEEEEEEKEPERMPPISPHNYGGAFVPPQRRRPEPLQPFPKRGGELNAGQVEQLQNAARGRGPSIPVQLNNIGVAKQKYQETVAAAGHVAKRARLSQEVMAQHQLQHQQKVAKSSTSKKEKTEDSNDKREVAYKNAIAKFSKESAPAAAAAAAPAGGPTTSLATNYVKILLAGDINRHEMDVAVKATVNKVLMSATGYTTATAPSSLPFPPADVTLDIEQLDEVAHEIAEERHNAVADTVRRVYTELKSRHDQITMMHEQTIHQGHSDRRAIGGLKEAHNKEMKDLKNRHKEQVGKLNEKIMQLEEAARRAKDAAAEAKATQTKSLETMMKASILSLRMIRKNEKQ